MGFIGYVECDSCDHYVHINEPNDIKIWYHPDDPQPLAEVDCPKCGETVQSRIAFDHMRNFRMRGCVIKDWNDRFEDTPLTEELIDKWAENDHAELEAELLQFLGV